MDDEIREIAERISGLRDACGYTQEEFAKELGIDIDTYKSTLNNFSKTYSNSGKSQYYWTHESLLSSTFHM